MKCSRCGTQKLPSGHDDTGWSSACPNPACGEVDPEASGLTRPVIELEYMDSFLRENPELLQFVREESAEHFGSDL